MKREIVRSVPNSELPSCVIGRCVIRLMLASDHSYKFLARPHGAQDQLICLVHVIAEQHWFVDSRTSSVHYVLLVIVRSNVSQVPTFSPLGSLVRCTCGRIHYLLLVGVGVNSLYTPYEKFYKLWVSIK